MTTRYTYSFTFMCNGTHDLGDHLRNESTPIGCNYAGNGTFALGLRMRDTFKTRLGAFAGLVALRFKAGARLNDIKLVKVTH